MLIILRDSSPKASQDPAGGGRLLAAVKQKLFLFMPCSSLATHTSSWNIFRPSTTKKLRNMKQMLLKIFMGSMWFQWNLCPEISWQFDGSSIGAQGRKCVQRVWLRGGFHDGRNHVSDFRISKNIKKPFLRRKTTVIMSVQGFCKWTWAWKIKGKLSMFNEYI